MNRNYENGYEPEFDLEYRTALPTTRYMIATIPRSGSTFLSHLLWSSGCLGAPLEYLNFDKSGHHDKLYRNPAAQIEYWQRVQHTRTTSNGVFGFKCFLMQLKLIGKENPRLYEQINFDSVIFLDRRDRVAHAVSYAKAIESRIWTKEQESSAYQPLKYSFRAIEQAAQWISDQRAVWNGLLNDLGSETLLLYYEDVVDEPSETLRVIAKYLKTDLTSGENPRVPVVERQADALNRAWIRSYNDDSHEKAVRLKPQ